jgi:hypothetical protein
MRDQGDRITEFQSDLPRFFGALGMGQNLQAAVMSDELGLTQRI